MRASGRAALASVASVGVLGSVVAMVSCAGADRRALGLAAPRPAMSLVRVVPLTTTTVARTTTTVAPTTTVPPTTTTVPVTEPPTTTLAPGPQPEPAPPLVTPLAPAGSGARGDTVAALQQRLLDLGFWIDEVDGEYGHVTVQAVMAFQKYYVDFGLETSGRADQPTIDALTAVTHKPFADVTTQPAAAVVVDKGRQVLHIVAEGRTSWTLNTSTGNGRRYTETDQKRGGTITGVALTPDGSHKVYREWARGWESGELGELYRPKYFAGGVAVHGSNSIPNYPASHGCVRITTTAMDWIWANDLMPRGTVVLVHG